MSANATAFLPAEFAERLFNQMRGRLPNMLTKYVKNYDFFAFETPIIPLRKTVRDNLLIA
jgi:hypothetical protein